MLSWKKKIAQQLNLSFPEEESENEDDCKTYYLRMYKNRGKAKMLKKGGVVKNL